MNYFVSLLSAPTDADWLSVKSRALVTIGKQAVNPPSTEWKHAVEKLREEIISEIQEIYKTNPAGGALHIVLDDGNTDSRSIRWCLANSIHEIEDMKVRELFVKCACDLLEIGDERTRDNVIWVAFDRMRGDNSEQG